MLKSHIQIRSLLVLVLFTFQITFTFAQKEKINPQIPAVKEKGLFIDLGAGFLILDDANYPNLSLGIGHRFTPSHGIGLNANLLSINSVSNNFAIDGLGLHYRLSYYGVIFKIGAGKVLGARRSWDHEDVLQYQSGSGYYIHNSLSYQHKSGFTIGAHLNAIKEVNFDYLSFDLNTDSHILTGDWQENELHLAILLGYSFPKKRQENP